MSEVKVGDEYIRSRGDVTRWTVRAVSEDRYYAWIEGEGGVHLTVVIETLLSNSGDYVKVVPFFGIGKSYQFRHGAADGFVYRAIELKMFGGKRYAILERYKGGKPDAIISLGEDSFDTYKEI